MWFILLMTLWLVTGSVMDIRSRRVPVWLLVIGVVFSVILSLCQCIGGERAYGDILMGIFPGMGLLAVAFATKKAGYGDGIVLICLGMMLGGGNGLLLLGLSLFFICIFSIVLLIMRKVGRNTGIPYLPFLAGAWVTVNVLIKI